MECRCPACHAFVRANDPVESSTWLTCWFCDRGFRAADARCPQCTGPLPLGQSCACEQPATPLRLVALA